MAGTGDDAKKLADKSPLKMDIRLFTHIHSDNRLLGSFLQGEDFANTCQYIVDVFPTLNLSKKESANLQILNKLEKFKKRFLSIRKLRNDPEHQERLSSKTTHEAWLKFYTTNRSHSDFIKKISEECETHLEGEANDIVSEIQKLKPGNSILIPGGWKGVFDKTETDSAQGHAMVYEFKRESNGDITFLIYNTGAGVNYHLRSPDHFLNKYNPIFAYRLPKEVDSGDFSKYIQELIKPVVIPGWISIDTEEAIKNEYKYNENRLYQEIFPKALLLGGEIIPPPQSEHLIQDQFSGTCAMRVLFPLIKNLYLEEETKVEANKDHQAFVYAIKKQSLVDFLSYIKEQKKQSDPNYVEVLSKALVKFSTLVLAYSKETERTGYVLSREEIKEGLALVESIQTFIEPYLNPQSTQTVIKLEPDRNVNKKYIRASLGTSLLLPAKEKDKKEDIEKEKDEKDKKDTKEDFDKPSVITTSAQKNYAKELGELFNITTYSSTAKKEQESQSLAGQSKKSTATTITATTAVSTPSAPATTSTTATAPTPASTTTAAPYRNPIIKFYSAITGILSSQPQNLPIAQQNLSMPQPPVLLNHILQNIKSLYEQCLLNETQKNSMKLISDVQSFLFALPINGPNATNFWKTLTKEEAKNYLSYLQNILSLYDKHCSQTSLQYPFPQRIIAKYFGVAAALHLYANYFEEYSSDKDKGLLENLGYEWMEHYHEYVKSGFFVSLDPHFDEKHKELVKFQEDNKIILDYYHPSQIREKRKEKTRDFFDRIIGKYQLTELFTNAVDPTSKVPNPQKARYVLYILAKYFETPEAELVDLLKKAEINLDVPTLTKYKKEINSALDDFDTYLQFQYLEKDCSTLKTKPMLNKASRLHEVTASLSEEYNTKTQKYEPCVDFRESDYHYFNAHEDLSRAHSRIQRQYLRENSLKVVEDRWHNFSNRLMVDFKKSNIAKSTTSEEQQMLNVLFTRATENTQIASSLDLFNSQLELFTDLDLQTYFLMNIFYPNLLIDGAKQNPSILRSLTDLIKRGLGRYFDPVKLKPEGLFFLKLANYTQRYIEYYSKQLDPKAVNDCLIFLKSIDNHILEWINTNKTKRDENCGSRIRALYENYLQRLYLKLKRQPVVFSDADCSQLLEGLLWINIAPILKRSDIGTPMEVDPQLEKDLAALSFNTRTYLEQYLKKLEKDPKTLDETINKLIGSVLQIQTSILQQFSIPIALKDVRWEGKFPNYHTKNIEINPPLNWNALNGSIAGPEYIWHEIPSAISQTELFIKFFGRKSKIAKIFHQEPLRCEFRGEDNYDYRVIQNKENNTCIIQRSINQGPMLQLKENFNKDNIKWLPTTLCQEGQQFWLEVEKPYKGVITDKQGKLLYELESGSSERTERTVQTDGSIVLKANHWDSCIITMPIQQKEKTEKYQLTDNTDYWNELAKLLPILKRFEDPKYIECWQSEASLKDKKEPFSAKIRLPRYGLTLDVKKDKLGSFELTLEGKPNYYLSLAEQPVEYGLCFEVKKPEIEAKEKAEKDLKLADSKADSKKTEEDVVLKDRVVMLPLQQYYTNEKETAHYRKFILDTSHIAKTNIYDNNYRLSKSSPARKTLDESINHPEHLWHYNNRETYLSYKLNEKNELVAKSSLEYLYLAYRQLAEHKPELALKTLKQGFQDTGYKGSLEEIELLRRMMSDIPVRMGINKNKNESSATKNDPETLAVRAYAAFLIAGFKRDGKKVPKKVEPRIESDKTLPHQYIQEYSAYQLSNFYNQTFPAISIKIMNSYLRVIGNIPVDMQLATTQEELLLRHSLDAKESGPLQTRFKRLEMASLEQEANALKKLKSSRVLSNAETTRLLKLEKILKKVYQFQYQSSHLIQKKYEVNFQKMDLTKTLEGVAASYRKKWGNPSEYTHDPKYDDIFITAQFIAGKEVTYKKLKNLTIKADNVAENFLELYDICLSVKEEDERKRLKTKFLGILKSLFSLASGGNECDLCAVLIAVLENPDEKWPRKLNGNYGESASKDTFIPSLKALVYSQKSFTGQYQKIVSTEKAVDFSFQNQKETNDFIGVLESDKTNKEDINKAHVQKPSNHSLAEEFNIKLPEVSKIGGDKSSIDIKTAHDFVFTLSPRLKEEPFALDYVKKLHEDYQQGKKINQEKELQRQEYAKIFSDKSLINKIQTNIEQKVNVKPEDWDKWSVEAQLKEKQSKLIALANQYLEPKASQKTKIEILGKRQKLFGLDNFNDLLDLYLSQSKAKFYARTGTHDDQGEQSQYIQTLYNSIHDYLLDAVYLQKLKRSSKILSDITRPTTQASEIPDLSLQLGNELSRKSQYVHVLHPELLLFEYYNNIALRPEQVKYLEDFIQEKKEGGFKDQVKQIIMGGGKTKTGAPILAKKKAKKNNLSIIEVPHASFKTNIADLKKTVQKTYGQEAFPFYFERSFYDSAQQLKILYKDFKHIKTVGGILITTPESLKGLELKYLGLLAMDAEKLPFNERLELDKQTVYLEAILKMIYEQGDVLIDEIDSNLNPRLELNYTVGAEVGLPLDQRILLTEIARFFERIALPFGMQKTLRDLMARKAELEPKQVTEVLKQLSKALIDEKDSPIASIVAKLNLDVKEKINLRLYLNNALSKEEGPKFQRILLTKLDKNERRMLALVKGEISMLLPSTLKRNPNEHFGFSHLPGQPKIAIPYLGHNTPNENSRFKSIYESVNYNQSLFANEDYMPIEYVTAFVTDLQSEAQTEISNYKGLGLLKMDKTTAGIKFEKMFPNSKLTLETLDPEDLNDMIIFQKSHVKNNKAAEDHIMVHQVLPVVTSHEKIFRSDAQNHGSQFRSRQGWTGTAWLKDTFPDSMTFDEKTSKGVDGQTIDMFLQKNAKVHVIDDETPSGLIEGVLKSYLDKKDATMPKIRALIDVGAFFKTSKSNLNVAKQMAEYFSKQASNPIEYVLFFNNEPILKENGETIEQNTLCALSLKDNSIIEVGSSEPDNIKSKLAGSSPDKWFTFYDQVHTTGIDIPQAFDATAIETVGSTSLFRDVSQGALRMRNYLNRHGQNIEPVIRSDTAKMKGSTDWKTPDLLQLTIENQIDRLGEDHFRSTCQKIQNVVRRDILTRIFNIDRKNIDKKRAYFKEAQKVFLTDALEDPLEIYGMSETEEGVNLVFETLKKDTLKEWKSLRAFDTTPIKPNEEQDIAAQLDSIIKKAIPLCFKNIKISNDSNFGLFAQTQQQKDTQKYKELDKQQALFNANQNNVRAYYPSGWIQEFIGNQFSPYTKKGELYERGLYSIDSLFELAKTKPTFAFGKNVFVSDHFRTTYDNQQNKIDNFLKPLKVILWVNDPTQPINPFVILLTQEEASEFMTKHYTLSRIKDFGSAELRFMTPHGIEIPPSPYGKASRHMDIKQQQSLQEQIAFLNGDADVLTTFAPNFVWLNENLSEKLNYLDTVILQNHPEKRKFFNILSERLSANKPKDWLTLRDLREEPKNAADLKKVADIKSSADIKILLDSNSAAASATNNQKPPERK